MLPFHPFPFLGVQFLIATVYGISLLFVCVQAYIQTFRFYPILQRLCTMNADIRIQVALNGMDFTDSRNNFSYYQANALKVL